jgi:hypothetical protein
MSLKCQPSLLLLLLLLGLLGLELLLSLLSSISSRPKPCSPHLSWWALENCLHPCWPPPLPPLLLPQPWLLSHPRHFQPLLSRLAQTGDSNSSSRPPPR